MMSDGTLVKEIAYDWFYSAENGEEVCRAMVGDIYCYPTHSGGWHEMPMPEAYKADKIVYHEPRGEGDRHYADIYKPDGTVIRTFNLSSVTFMKDGEA